MSSTPSLSSVQVGDVIAEYDVHFTRDVLVRYAGASGDFNPIHYRDDIAKSVGLEGVLAHGMLTMGLGAAFVSKWSGDPGAVSRYAVRLAQPAIVSATHGADIEYSGRIKSLDPTTRAGTVIVVAKSAGRKIFGLATAEIRLR